MNKPSVNSNANSNVRGEKKPFFKITIGGFVAKNFSVDTLLYLCQSSKNYCPWWVCLQLT